MKKMHCSPFSISIQADPSPVCRRCLEAWAVAGSWQSKHHKETTLTITITSHREQHSLYCSLPCPSIESSHETGDISYLPSWAWRQKGKSARFFYSQTVMLKEFSSQTVLYSKDIFIYSTVFMCNHLEYISKIPWTYSHLYEVITKREGSFYCICILLVVCLFSSGI
jgi:hypothetical protein